MRDLNPVSLEGGTAEPGDGGSWALFPSHTAAALDQPSAGCRVSNLACTVF